MKKNLYLVQVGVSGDTMAFLPYAIGCIAAYLKNDSEITNKYDIKNIIGIREDIDNIIKKFTSPDIVAFSCYTWNLEYNKVLAKKIKDLYPQVKIIFGGHSVPANASFLDEFDFIDYLMHNEGEETTSILLKALENGDSLEDVPNLSFRTENTTKTTFFRHPENISNYPSPYTTGVFDHLLEEYPEIEFHATLETNRGCPYACAYCEWCYTKKIRQFPMSKIKKEIEWIAKNKIQYCYCADANFGILKRDIKIAQYVVEQKNKYGYPHIFKPCYAKNSDETVFEAGCILNQNHTDKGVTLAYQSLDSITLKNIGRKNMPPELFFELNNKYKQVGIPTYSEVILGLPGETFDSFSEGICRLLECGQNNGIPIYECQVYPNTKMGNPEFQKKHGIKTTKIPLFGIHYYPDFKGVNEFFDIVTETASMPADDWVKAYMFSVISQVFHNFGLLRCFALFAKHEKGVSFKTFYTKLYDFIYNENNGFINSVFHKLYLRKADTKKADWTYQNDEYGKIGWYFEEGAFLELLHDNDQFWAEIKPFLQTLEIDNDLFEMLFEYQKQIINLPGKDYVEIVSDFAFYPYFAALTNGEDAKLKKVKNKLCLKPEKPTDSWQSYAKEVIWYGKKNGATLLTNMPKNIEYKEF